MTIPPNCTWVGGVSPDGSKSALTPIRLGAPALAIAIRSILEDQTKSPHELAADVLAVIESSGHRIVPVEPTEAMSNAGSKQVDYTNRYTGDVADNVYDAMLTAAPKVPA